MVICKYYRQGNCRYGQYCQFEHVNNFGNKTEYNEDDIAVTVAKEVLLAERGGQWLLSCFGPLRDRPCIPGMEDLSPDEVRWEMYQAQKNGMVEQAKIHFQQLCQDMKAKRDALKNPTRETITMLKKILGSGQKGGLNTSVNTSGKSSTFSFAAPQLGLTNSMSNNNVFGSTTFGVQSNNNPFGGGGFTSSSASSIFGKSTNPVFGGTATFGNNLGVFGNSGTSNQTSSIFGATSTSSSFSGAQTNTLAFGTAQNNSVFGGSSQNVFGQNSNVFGGTNQLGNATSGSLFSNPLTSQANTSIFGGATTTTASLFGGDTSSTGLQTNSVFGGASTTMSGGIFNQSKTSAFGGTLGFGGGTTSYASTSGNSIFGGNQTFGTASTSNIFGGTLTTTPAFGAPIAATSAAFDLTQQQSSTNTFGATSAPNVFGMQNNDSMNNPSFGTPAATIGNPFVTSSQQINSTSTISTPFANTGLSMAGANNTFATTGTSSNSIFASAATTFATSNATVPKNSPFAASTFGNAGASSSPFDSTKTSLAGTTLANPFAPRTQQTADSPFGSVAQNQTSSPFGRTPLFSAPPNDDSVYSAEGALTDEEKEMYLAQRFIIGKIPVKPPTKDMR